MVDKNITPLQKKTLIKMIANSVGARIFNSIIVKFEDSGMEIDVCNDGEFSCAFFVSGLLVLTKYINEPSATVNSLRKKLMEIKFEEIKSIEKVEPGDIVFWEKLKFDDGSENEHVGFVLNKNQAVSTSYREKCVVLHDIEIPINTGNSKRKVVLILRPGSN